MWQTKSGRMLRALGAAAVATGCALLAAACAATATPQPLPAGTHQVRADELSAVMRSFDEVARQRVPGEVDQHDRWEGIYPAIADAAAELKVSANALAGHPPKGLELPDRGRFSVLGRSFSQAAENLEQAAARGDEDAVVQARAEVGAACQLCHAKFRPDAPGMPEAFQ